MTLHAGLASEIQKLAPSAIIELFELDATAIGGTLVRFHAGTNQLSGNIVWQGNTYTRYPVAITGFEYNGKGPFPRPKLQVSNVLSAITAILITTGDLLGAVVTRKRTLAKFLDAVNFTGGVNATADTTAEFPYDIYSIDRKSHEDRDTVEFELATPTDLVSVSLPRRQIIQNICVWEYRGTECGYTGAPLYDFQDDLLTSATSVYGAALISTYNAYIASIATAAATVTALTATAQARDTACAIVLIETRFNYGQLVPVVAGDYFVFSMAAGNPGYTAGAITAYFNGAAVSLGTTYRQGVSQGLGQLWVTATRPVLGTFYKIQRWGADSGACSTATTAYNTAVTNRDNAATAMATALSAFNTAFAALPVDDPIYSSERCGKRLTSCKARFGENNPLPFGSFPAAGLFK